MTPFCIIPARTGSVRIPRKNFTLLAGMSPVSRALDCCQRAFSDARVIVSTNCHVSDPRYHCAEPPLHTDTCSMVDIVLNVLDTYPGDPKQPILLVQPTQPLRQPKHLWHADECLAWASSVVSVAETISMDKLYRRADSTRLIPLGGNVERDQQGNPTYYCDGTVYGFRRGWFLEHRSFRDSHETVTFVVPAEETARLDTMHDWQLAELRLREQSRQAHINGEYD